MARLLITGVNRGIGEGLLRQYLESGHEVCAIGRFAPQWADSHGPRFVFHECDLSDFDALEQISDQIDQPLDTLICSAADFGGDAFHLDHFSPNALARAFAVNCIAPAILTRAMKPNLENGTRRHIVFMTTGNASLSGNTEGAMLAYRTTKSALNQLMRNVAAEWAGSGFATVALNPGWVRTDMGGEQAPMSVQQAAHEIYDFCETRLSGELTGRFCNTDGSEIPWCQTKSTDSA